jgi:hypothetical protein
MQLAAVNLINGYCNICDTKMLLHWRTGREYRQVPVTDGSYNNVKLV